MTIIPGIFQDHESRRLFGEKTEAWCFSVVDIIQILTQQPDYQAARNYWKVLKNRLAEQAMASKYDCLARGWVQGCRPTPERAHFRP